MTPEEEQKNATDIASQLVAIIARNIEEEKIGPPGMILISSQIAALALANIGKDDIEEDINYLIALIKDGYNKFMAFDKSSKH